MFSDSIALQIAQAAEKAGIPKAGMLAIVEVETAGSPTEADGRTPNFLFERHIFRRELAARQPGKVKQAEAAGLAYPHWRPKTATDQGQYFDEKTSAAKLALLARAKAIDEDCALRSCSWGLPQIMGNECLEVGFPSARSLVDYMSSGGVAAHIEVMIRFLKSRKLVSAIEAKDWAYVALKYNGAGYEKNHYDTRLAAANRKWERRLPTLDATTTAVYPEEHLSHDEIRQIQINLRDLGYVEAGQPDGRWGDKTATALWAFQKHEGLPTTGHYDETTKAALNEAQPRPVPPDRQDANLDDLRKDGSTTIAMADNAETLGKGKLIAGGTIAAGGVLEQAGPALDTAQDAADKIGTAKSVWNSLHEALHPIFGHWLILVLALALIVVGYFVIRYARRIKESRLSDHQNGTHAGRYS